MTIRLPRNLSRCDIELFSMQRNTVSGSVFWPSRPGSSSAYPLIYLASDRAYPIFASVPGSSKLWSLEVLRTDPTVYRTVVFDRIRLFVLPSKFLLTTPANADRIVTFSSLLNRSSHSSMTHTCWGKWFDRRKSPIFFCVVPSAISRLSSLRPLRIKYRRLAPESTPPVGISPSSMKETRLYKRGRVYYFQDEYLSTIYQQ